MLIKSGIVGFDDLLFGGFIKNSAILVEGVPGAGKTTWGLCEEMKCEAFGDECCEFVLLPKRL